MAVSYQLVMDCADSDLLARFWAEALRYRIALPPEGHETWDDFYRAIGVSEDQLDGRIDRIEDPNGEGPAIWFQVSPDPKSVPNRMHIDVHASGDRRDPLDARRERVDAEAARLVDPRRHAPGLTRRGGDGSLRRRDDGPRGQRVRHQLIVRSECVQLAVAPLPEVPSRACRAALIRRC